MLIVVALLAAEPPARPIAAELAFSGGVVASSVIAGAVAYGIGVAQFQSQGRPDPLVTASSLVVASGLKLALQYFLAPQLYLTGGGDPDITATRDAMWRWIRWPAAAAAVSVLLFFVAAQLEHDRYGRGQVLMIGSFAALAASHTLVDIFSIVGSVKAYRQ